MTKADLKLLGLDIGGTRSRARLWADGGIAAECEGPSASVPAAGAVAAKAALEAVLAGLDLDPAQPVDAICAGSAGLSVPGAREFLHEQLAPLAQPGSVVIVSDAMLVLPAADLDAGIALICGTGSVAVATFRERTLQTGGWGYLLGDEGGGYWIAREAVRTLLRRREQGVPAGELGREMLSATGSADVATLQRCYYAQPHFPRDWARLARLVLESADPAGAQITGRAADAAAALAAEAARLLDLPGSFPVVLAGGLMANASFRYAVAGRVASTAPLADVRVLEDAPVAGAIRLAGRAVGQISAAEANP